MGSLTHKYCLRVDLPKGGGSIRGSWQPYDAEDIETLRHLLNGPGEFGRLEIVTDEGWAYLSAELLKQSVVRLWVRPVEVVDAEVPDV